MPTVIPEIADVPRFDMLTVGESRSLREWLNKLRIALLALAAGGGGGGSPGAPNKSVQVNVGGVFTGDANFLWDTASITLQFGDGAVIAYGKAGRITGNTSDATQSNRFFFQNSIAGGNTIWGLLPNGASTTSVLRAFNNSNPNAALGFVQMGISTNVVIFDASTIAGGTQPTIELRIAGATAFDIDVAKNARIAAGWQRPVVTKNANYTILETDSILFGDASAGSFTFTLPAANVAGAGFSPGLRIKRIDNVAANTITVSRAGADTIDAGTTFVLGALQSCDLESDGVSKWGIV